MDNQNSKGQKDHSCNTKATLQYAAMLKTRIQEQVFELTAALKKAEHVLCMKIDDQCRTKLQGLEYLCESDKCGASCQNLDTQFDDDDGFPKMSDLDTDFRFSMVHIQNYGESRESPNLKIMTQTSEAIKDIPADDQGFSCPACACSAFPTAESLRNHYESVHLGAENAGHGRRIVNGPASEFKLGSGPGFNYPFTRLECKCPYCFQSFPNIEAMKRHLFAENNLDGGFILNGPACKTKLGSGAELNSHVPIYYTSNKEEQVEPREDAKRAGGSEEGFEFVDASECLKKEETENSLKNLMEEALEKASCSSADSFDVIPNECCLKDSVCTNTRRPRFLPCPPPPYPMVRPKELLDRLSSCSGFFPPKSEKKEGLLPKKAPANVINLTEDKKVYISTSKGTAFKNEHDMGLTVIFHGNAKEKSTKAGDPTTAEVVDEVLPSTSKAKDTAQKVMCAGIVSASKGVLGGLFSTSKASTPEEISTTASVPTTTEVVADDIENIPSTSEANAITERLHEYLSHYKSEEMTLNTPEEAGLEEPSAVPQDENNPATALQDSFKSYLKKQDLKAWVKPNSEPRSYSYEDWVFRPAAPSNPLTELPNGSGSRESACSSDGVSAFYRQLQGFVA